MNVTLMEERILRSVQVKLLRKKNVVAVGIGCKEIGGKRTETKAIICSVSKKEPLSDLKKKDAIPTRVWLKPPVGMPTDVKEEPGGFKVRTDRKKRIRPAPGGVCIGHEWVTAGTLGCLVGKGGNVYILSNNHVLADTNNAPLGSAILQPGKYSGGEPIDRIASLTEFVPIEFGGGEGCNIGQAVARLANFFAGKVRSQTRLEAASIRQVANRVDAAIACPLKDDLVKNEILGIGKISGWGTAVLGTKVKKSGRTTGVTHGEITQVNVMVNVQYGNGKIAMFTDQHMIEPGGFSAGGDSGSAVLDEEDDTLYELLFAGSDKSTIVSPIEFVLADLNLDFNFWQ